MVINDNQEMYMDNRIYKERKYFKSSQCAHNHATTFCGSDFKRLPKSSAFCILFGKAPVFFPPPSIRVLLSEEERHADSVFIEAQVPSRT